MTSDKPAPGATDPGARLVRLLARHSDETVAHVVRVARYTGLIARRAGLGPAASARLEAASRLHDIGKIGVPAALLAKPGALTPAERRAMQAHTTLGRRLLRALPPARFGLAATVAWTHHERFDGTGYPRGLSGHAIPLAGRIVQLADAFDALTTRRAYKPAFGLDRALSLLAAGRGTWLDPALLDLLLAAEREVAALHAVVAVPPAAAARRGASWCPLKRVA